MDLPKPPPSNLTRKLDEVAAKTKALLESQEKIKSASEAVRERPKTTPGN